MNAIAVEQRIQQFLKDLTMTKRPLGRSGPEFDPLVFSDATLAPELLNAASAEA